jgi:hypothetical protein
MALVRERDPFSRALASLREQLRRGAYGLGLPLPIADLARDLDLSATPVREALCRLAGEGLVEDLRGRGFQTRRLDANELAELYDLQHLQLGFAVVALAERRSARGRRPTAEGEPPSERGSAEMLAVTCEGLFDRIVQAGGHRALGVWHRTVSDRLGPARRLEAQAIDDVAAELVRIEAVFDAAGWNDQRTEQRRFHKRRRGAATIIADLLRSPG